MAVSALMEISSRDSKMATVTTWQGDEFQCNQ